MAENNTAKEKYQPNQQETPVDRDGLEVQNPTFAKVDGSPQRGMPIFYWNLISGAKNREQVGLEHTALNTTEQDSNLSAT